ncbi:MAG TPA: NAD(P)H-dependent oxidoreductase [Steroidobacteraceae bacterium]|jgi:FMN-dependent NADH-azoreductase|nr:NAD(P)H-dependent oxidoreductase [Steroidobacteraceae bacterium]
MQLLHIDSSVLGTHSVSRALSADIVARQIALHPGIKVTHRDLAADAALHLSSAHLAVWQGGAVEDGALGADLAKGNGYLEELFAADILVIGAPMYNFSIPSQLKAWIDRVVVAGKTFRYGANGPEGLLKNKKLFIASSRGSVYAAGSPAAALEHHDSYLTGVLSFIGLTDVTIVRAEGLALGAEAKEAAVLKARQNIAAMAA